MGEICDVYQAWDGTDRARLLRSLARVRGVYVPSLYRPEYDARGKLRGVHPVADDLPAVVEKRVLRDLNDVPVPDAFVVPNVKVVHGRPSLEVMRGCVKGCRFCQAGYIYRPLRERDPRRVLAEAERAVARDGHRRAVAAEPQHGRLQLRESAPHRADEPLRRPARRRLAAVDARRRTGAVAARSDPARAQDGLHAGTGGRLAAPARHHPEGVPGRRAHRRGAADVRSRLAHR